MSVSHARYFFVIETALTRDLFVLKPYPRFEPAVSAFSFWDRRTTSTLKAAPSVAAPPTRLRSANSRSTSRVSHFFLVNPFGGGIRAQGRKRTDSRRAPLLHDMIGLTTAAAINELRETGKFQDMDLSTDEDEHR